MEDDQKPYNVEMNWDPEADIILKGYEWQDISNILQIFQSAMVGYNAATARNVSSGVIKVKYVYEDGTEVPESVLEKRRVEQMNAFAQSVKDSTKDKKLVE